MEWDPSTRSSKDNYRFLVSAVAPRPIAWVTTRDPATGVVNAAPFSWFNAVCPDPPMVMLAIGRRPDGSPKDTLRNIRASREFVVNASPRAVAGKVVATAAEYPPDVSEVAALGLGTLASRTVAPPRLADSPLHLECRLHDVIPLGRDGNHSLVLGTVVHIGCDDAVLDARGLVDPARLVLLARLGGSHYADTSQVFDIPWPKDPGDPLRRPER
jgi:flavin reductase (DIM6/NTAB) family NADH-FMN oxidoreductase RutF